MRKISWGVIGAGGIADRRTIPALLQASNCKLAAVMDVRNVESLSQKYQVPGYADEAQLLAHPGVEAVYIATPVCLHLRQIQAAAAAGKHVLVEKPLCMTSSEAREAIAACRRAGVLLQEGYMMRLHGAHQRILEILRSGQIGKPVYVRAQLSCWYPKIDGAWRQEPSSGGGGALIDMATHLYDLLEMLIGRITRVGALVSTQVQDYPVEDSATTLLEFQSGCHGTTDTFYCLPDSASRTRLEIYGSRGSILSEGTIGQGSSGKLEVYSEEAGSGYEAGQRKDIGPDFRDESFLAVNPYTRECELFADAVLEGAGTVKVNDPDHGLHIVEVAEAAYRSAREGRIIEVGR